MKFVIGSRGSVLALKQSEEVKKALENKFPELEIEIKVIHTKGDQILNKPLHQIGDKGLFTQEIEKELLNGTIDLAVHSMKDMPSSLPEGLVFTGTIKANMHQDCLVFLEEDKTLETLRPGAIVATGSPRRKAQLLKLRSDLQIVGIRGNVLTRLKKMEENQYDALVLAAAGLHRLDMEERIGQILEVEEMVPACAQGILAIEVKKDAPIISYIEEIIDKETTRRYQLERLFMETIQGSCHQIIGCHITFGKDGIMFDAILGKENSDDFVRGRYILHSDYETKIKEIALKMKEEANA